MSIPTLEGIESKIITTSRITTRVLFSGQPGAHPVLFLHGNWSCATWWEDTLLALPEGFWGIAPDQRGYGESEKEKKINAVLGAQDWVEDVAALLDHLNIERAHIVGCSLGGYIIWQLMIAYPERILSVTQINPGSPYGFSGTKGNNGELCYPDFAGTGGGIKNPELIQRVIDQDRGMENELSPRLGIRSLFIHPFIPAREEALLSSVLATHIGEQEIPGDYVVSPNWPFVAPGIWGPHNAVSPKYAGEVKRIYDGRISVPVLWIRGSHDRIVSDQSTSDIGYLGKIGLIPDWPGEDIYPPQPMLSQTRSFLDKYSASGGTYQEVVIENTAHIPFIEKPDKFNGILHSFLESTL